MHNPSRRSADKKVLIRKASWYRKGGYQHLKVSRYICNRRSGSYCGMKPYSPDLYEEGEQMTDQVEVGM